MRIVEFRQTAFVTLDDQVLCSLAVDGWDHCNPYYVSAYVGGEPAFVRKPNWAESMAFFLPAVREKSALTLELMPFEEISVSRDFAFLPPKPWKIDFFLSSHEDLGYCAYVNALGEECAQYLDAAMDLAEKYPEYAYVIEHFWWLRGFETYRGEEDKRRLRRLLHNGQIELSAPHCGNHTHWQGQEQLTRALYFGCRDTAKTFGITPKTVVYADIAGATWSCVSAYRQAGIEYLLILSNKYLRFSRDDEALPRVFWWVAPNGKDRLLCFLQDGYKQREISDAMGAAFAHVKGGEPYVFDATKMEQTVKAVDDLIRGFSDAPYDRIPVSFYMDREYPSDDLVTLCRSMGERWKYPVFGISTPERTLGDIKAQCGDQLPELSGDITDQWADFAAISPTWFGWKRGAQELFSDAETLSLMAAMEGRAASLPLGRLKEAMWRMTEFDDHCWATSSKNPQAMHKFNLYLVKRESARVALQNVRDVIQESIGKPSPAAFSAWNTLPAPRTASLILPAGKRLPGLPWQRLADGTVLTPPVSLPALGHQNFAWEEALAQSSAPARQEAKDAFETSYYKVRTSEKSQRVLSIVDKETGEELLDAASPYGLGEFLYVHAEQKAQLPISIEVPQRRGLHLKTGPLATQIIQDAFEEQMGANIRSVLTFYQYEKNIDIHLSFENASGLMGDFYDRYKKNIFFAFPLRMPDHHFSTELALGVVDERQDRLPINPHDFVVAHSWVSVENGRRGIGLFSREMPVFHLGGIHYNKISAHVDYSQSASIFLYAASNRANSLNYCEAEDCRGEYHLSLLPFTGAAAEALPAWSFEKLHPPLLGGPMPEDASSRLTLEGKNARLLCFKYGEARDGSLFLRLCEVAGRKAQTTLTFAFDIAQANLAGGLEEPGAPLPLEDGRTLSLALEPYSYLNLLVRPATPFVPAMERETRDVKNLFTFVSEHRDTILCFEKCNRLYARYRLLEGGQEIAAIADDAHLIQYCVLPGRGYQDLRVKPDQESRRS